MSAFRFNKDYHDTEQVRQFMPAFLRRHAEIVASGKYTYNDSFKGHMGIDDGDEDTAIYLCQTLKQLDEIDANVKDCLAQGYRTVSACDFTETIKCKSIIRYGWYMGGTGWQEWQNARLVPVPNSRMLLILPRGKRTNGIPVDDKVLVLTD